MWHDSLGSPSGSPRSTREIHRDLYLGSECEYYRTRRYLDYSMGATDAGTALLLTARPTGQAIRGTRVIRAMQPAKSVPTTRSSTVGDVPPMACYAKTMPREFGSISPLTL